MSFAIIISKKAKLDIQKAKKYYEEKSIGLGEDFIVEVKSKINILITKNVDYKNIIDDIRRILLKRFPYVIYYERDIINQRIVIVAGLHEKQDVESNLFPI